MPSVSSQPISQRALLSAIAFAAFSLGYLVLFFTASDQSQAGGRQVATHSLVLLRAVVPDQIVGEWFGPAGTPRGLFDRLPVFAVAAWTLLAAYGAGWMAIDRLRLASDVTALERIVFSLAAGLNLLSLLTLGIGLAGGLLIWWLFAIILGVLTIVACWQLTLDWPSQRDQWSRLCNPQSALRNLQFALVAVIGLFAILLLLAAPLPPWDFDVREYHLQVPKEWFQQGRITFLPHNVYGNMPLSTEMNALLAMTVMPGELGWYYGALAGKVVMAAMTLVAAAGLYVAGRRFANPSAGLVAAAIYVAHPWVMQVSTSGLNDGVLAGYVFLAAYAAWLARDGRVSMLLPGFLAGAAAATKYPGLAFAVVPLALWSLLPAAPWTGDAWKRLRWAAAAWFVFGALLGGGAWYAKNAALTGNPTYPLLGGVFDGKTRTPERIAQWDQAHQVPRDEHGSRYSLAQIASAARRLLLADELANPLIVPFAGAGLLVVLLAFRRTQQPNPQSAILNSQSLLPFFLLAAFLLAVWFFASHRLVRFLLPLAPFAALFAGVGASWSTAKAWRWVSAMLLAFGLLYCLLAATSQLVGDNRYFVALDQPALGMKDDHVWLNEHVPPGRAVLLVGDAEPFDLNMPNHYNTCFDSCVLCDWMLGRSAAERKAELAKRGIAYVYVDWREIARYQSPGNYGYDPRFDVSLIDELVSQGVLGPPIQRQTEGESKAPAQDHQPEVYPVPYVLSTSP